MRLLLLGTAFALAASSAAPASADHACGPFGTPGDDVIVGTPGDDVICAGEGNDTIDGGDGADVILPGPGDDTVDGGSGSDWVSFEDSGSGVRVRLSEGKASGEGEDTLTSVENATGSASADVLKGDTGSNVLRGGGATDVLVGLGGIDELQGGDGEDHLRADAGSVTRGGSGSDVCIPAGESCGSPSPRDGDDTRGFLDVGQVQARFGNRVEFRIYLRNNVRRRQMWDSGYALVHLDTAGSSAYDYYAMVRANRRRFRAALWRHGRIVAHLPLWRSARNNFSFYLPLSYMSRGSGRAYYRWRVQTMTDRCWGWCWDLVTNEGGLAQPYPGVV
ncbi:MAG TPA: calcium-binding protein [Actinomycetota bacterium]|nr:calcium-binding protein [Actinomycetota bacterium]